MRRQVTIAVLIAAVSTLVMGFGIAELFADGTQRGDHAYLLDRGTTTPSSEGRVPAIPTATLWVGAGTPMALPNVLFVPSPMSIAPGMFLGNQFFAGTPQPSSFPSSWYPFVVSGAFGYQYAPGSPMRLPPAGMVAVGVFNPMGLTGFDQGTPVSLMSPGGLVTVTWGPMGLPVNTGQNFAVGVLQNPGGPMTPTLGIGGRAPTGMGRPLYAFSPMMMGVPMTVAAPPADWIAGARVTGANVPVELQAFHIE